MSTEQSELLAQLSTELASAVTDVSEVTNAAARAASALLGGHVTVQVIEDDGLLSTAARPSPDQGRGAPQRADEGLSGRLALGGLPIVTNAAGPDRIAASMPGLRPFGGEADTNAILLVPLLADGAYLGLMSVRRGADHPFLEADVGLGTDIAARIAHAVAATQAERRLRATIRGTGLSLASVRSTVRQVGGLVNLRSRPGVGTVAEAYLPAIDDRSRPEPSHPVPRTVAVSGVGRRGHGHVLVVEDEPAVARVVTRLLEDVGFTVEAPENADVALMIIRAGRPADLLITDVLMPGLTGPELGRGVREFRRDLPVLFMSGYVAGTLDDVSLLGAGTAVLEKPFSREALLDAVANLLGDEPAERKPPARGRGE